MALVSLAEALVDVRRRGGALGAFNVIQLEHAEALVAAAEQTGLPLVLQISENAARYHGALAPIASATRALAGASSVPLVLHLDHATSEELIDEALRLGFTSVMFDASTLDDAANRERTHAVVQRCHAVGVSVEAELGEVGGKNGVHSASARTDPGAARIFAEATGVDALAVAVGSSHAMVDRSAKIDIELIARVHGAVSVPIVLHGSSGVSDDLLRAAVLAGMSKINVATHLNRVFTGAIRQVLDADPALVDSRKYFAPARDAVAAEVARLALLLANPGSVA